MAIERKELERKIKADAELHRDYVVQSRDITIFPFFDRETNEVHRCAAMIITLRNEIKRSHYHNVVIAYKDDGYYYWCGDAFLSGSTKKRSKSEMIDAAKSIARSKEEELRMLSFFGKVQDKPCRFWSSGECSHVNHAFAELSRDLTLLDILEETYVGKKITKERGELDMVKKYMFKKHILLQGPKGTGKTYLAETTAAESDAEIFYLGGRSSTEASDFVGEYIPMAKAEEKKGQGTLFESPESSTINMVWKDGPLSQAFRHAQNGGKSIFVLDEMLRVDDRELSPLIPALTKTPNGTFKLQTGRAVGVEDGIAKEEVLECPCENFWMIATTNIGAAYNVEEMDEALADRVRTVMMFSEEDKMKEILKKDLCKRKYPASIADKLLRFFKTYEKRREDGAFKKICNLRQLSEAVEFSIDADDIKATLWEGRFAWVEMDIDGVPRAEQEKEVSKILEKIFG